jgi:hypothetical protein
MMLAHRVRSFQQGKAYFCRWAAEQSAVILLLDQRKCCHADNHQGHKRGRRQGKLELSQRIDP